MQLPRFYPILDTATLARCGCPVLDAAEALFEAGARIVQYRHKDHYSRQHLAEAEALAALCRDAHALLVINDRADIALLLDAALHVGQDDLSPADARRVLGPSRALGFSTHNESQFRAALDEPADYLALGPIFSTASKQNADPVTGTVTLQRVRPLTSRPIVAIGGITLDNASFVYAAGADSIALIGALFPRGCDKRSIRAGAEAWLSL